MLRSLFAGVSGLRNHQVRMDVIGNNIANVNTVAFKAGRVTFKEGFAQLLAGASRPPGDQGGINPIQVGLGMQIGSIDQLYTQGNIETTGQATDLAIQGDSMFVVRKGDQSFYTRSGNFQLDTDGRLVSPTNGFVVQGQVFQNGVLQDGVQDIRLPFGQKVTAKPTSEMRLGGNLNASAPTVPAGPPAFDINSAADRAANPGAWTETSLSVFDSQGTQRDVKIQLWKTGANEWQWQLDPTSPTVEATVTVGAAGQLPLPGATANSAIARITTASGATVSLDYVRGTAPNFTLDPSANIPAGAVLSVDYSVLPPPAPGLNRGTLRFDTQGNYDPTTSDEMHVQFDVPGADTVKVAVDTGRRRHRVHAVRHREHRRAARPERLHRRPAPELLDRPLRPDQRRVHQRHHDPARPHRARRLQQPGRPAALGRQHVPGVRQLGQRGPRLRARGQPVADRLGRAGDVERGPGAGVHQHDRGAARLPGERQGDLDERRDAAGADAAQAVGALGGRRHGTAVPRPAPPDRPPSSSFPGAARHELPGGAFARPPPTPQPLPRQPLTRPGHPAPPLPYPALSPTRPPMSAAPDPAPPADASAAKAGRSVPLALLLAVVAGLGAGGGAGALVVGPALADGIAPAVAATARARRAAHAAEKGARGGDAADDAAADDETPAGGDEAAGEEGTGEHGKAGASAPVYTLDNLVLNPAGSGGARFLLLTIAFELKSEATVETMKARDAELRDAVLVTVGNRTVEQLADVGVRDSLKLELQAATKKLFRRGVVRRVYFPQFVIQ
jgi:flagellar hook protein FlgE